MKQADSVAFGLRVRQRRKDLGMSQERLAKLSGQSQSNIGYIEQGNAGKPHRLAPELAPHLQTSVDWLLWEQGPKQVGPYYLPTDVLVQKYDALPPDRKAEISEAIENTPQNKKRKKAG